MEGYRRPVYLLNDSPSSGLSGALHYSASIDLFEGVATITRVGFSPHGIAIEDSRGRVIFIEDAFDVDDSLYPAKIQDWTDEVMKTMSEGRLNYPIEELKAIKEAFSSYVSMEDAGIRPRGKTL
jgi:hypothetical protein